MKNWIKYGRTALNRRFLVGLAAVAMVLSLAAYEFANPARAAAPAAAASASQRQQRQRIAFARSRHGGRGRTRHSGRCQRHRHLQRSPATSLAQPSVETTTATTTPTACSSSVKRSVQFGQHMQPKSQIEHGQGSGVIISPDGYIVTNNHVIDGAVDIRVTMTDRRILPAKLIGADPLTDLAVIKIDATNLPSVPLGDSTKLHPGQTVLAFGNPLGFRFTVTRGIVSALNRPNPFAADRRSPGEFIQTDAAINPGNSGGPLVNAHGEVVGINTFLVSETGGFSGMGFAIPTQIVQPTVDSLIKYGKGEPRLYRHRHQRRYPR